jgi:hypothetical protein
MDGQVWKEFSGAQNVFYEMRWQRASDMTENELHD